MSDTTTGVAKALRDIANELENEDVTLIQAEYSPDVGTVQNREVRVEWQNHE